MKKILRKLSLLLAVVALFVVLPVRPVLAAEPQPQLAIPVRVNQLGYPPAEPELFALTLTPDKPEYPMPANAVLELRGGSRGSFDPIRYSNPGIFTYTIRQSGGDHPRGTYDSRVYQITVAVTNDSASHQLTAALVAQVQQDGQPVKAAEIAFDNDYARPPEEPPAADEGTPGAGGTASHAPKTGDESHTGIVFLVLVLSAAGFVILWLIRRKRNH